VGTSEVELLEVFRLGEASSEADIVRDVGDRLAAHWERVSRFREMQTLTSRSLRVQSSPYTLLWAGLAQQSTGNLRAALDYYESIGMAHHRGGDTQVALNYYEQALPIVREVGDRAGEANTRYNIAMVHRGVGRLAEAVAELELVVALDAAVENPRLEADMAMLEQVRADLDQPGSGGGADAETGG
jgi:hypothetical protein